MCSQSSSPHPVQFRLFQLLRHKAALRRHRRSVRCPFAESDKRVKSAANSAKSGRSQGRYSAAGSSIVELCGLRRSVRSAGG